MVSVKIEQKLYRAAIDEVLSFTVDFPPLGLQILLNHTKRIYNFLFFFIFFLKKRSNFNKLVILKRSVPKQLTCLMGGIHHYLLLNTCINM